MREDRGARVSYDRGVRSSLTRFWVVLVATTIPFYLWGWLAGGALKIGGAELPLSALMFVCPALAAVAAGGIPIVRRAVAVRIRPVWWILAIVLPATATVTASLVATHGDTPTLPPALPLIILLYLATAFCEELGWTTVLLPALLRKHGAIVAGAAIGVVWALWHLIPYLQGGYEPGPLLGQLTFTVVFRILLVQLAVAGGMATLIAVLGHASYNVAWTVLEAAGRYSAIAAAVAVALAVVALFVFRPVRDSWRREPAPQ